MRVGIVGGGIGGMALAHGLRRQGWDTVVFDRDARPRDTAGYRLHPTPASLAALRGLLPAGLAAAMRPPPRRPRRSGRSPFSTTAAAPGSAYRCPVGTTC